MKKYKVRPFGHLEKREERREVLEKVRIKCSLEEVRERERENCERYIVRKRVVSKKKKKKCFLCSSCISKYYNLYLILWNYSELVPWFFPSRRKGFLCKFLYSYVIIFSLYLLKFINSYIEFFPIHFASNTLYSGQN